MQVFRSRGLLLAKGSKFEVINQHKRTVFGIAANLMRRILIDHARAHARSKRGGGAQIVSLDEAAIVSQANAAELISSFRSHHRQETYLHSVETSLAEGSDVIDPSRVVPTSESLLGEILRAVIFTLPTGRLDDFRVATKLQSGTMPSEFNLRRSIVSAFDSGIQSL